jgi:hypothetical protein
MADVEYAPAEATKENLRQIALDELVAYRLINGEPNPDGLRHLTARVRVLIEPGFSDQEIEETVAAASRFLHGKARG